MCGWMHRWMDELMEKGVNAWMDKMMESWLNG